MQILLSGPYVPFALSLGLLLALLAVEMVALLLGGSLLGSGDAGLDVSPEVAALEASFDLAPDAVPDLDQLIAASAALQDMSAAPQAAGPGPGAGAAGPGLLGLGHSPFMVWLAAALLGFGVTGIAVQSLTGGILGAPLPVLPVAMGAGLAGLGFARQFARAFGRMLPGLETSATSAQFMGGLRGVVSQGTARAGMPAEVRLRDRHGNIHYLRCEPFSDRDVIPEGTEVLTLRERLGPDRWGLRILPLT